MSQQHLLQIHALKQHMQQVIDEALEAVARASDAHAEGFPSFAAAEVMSAHNHLVWVMQQLQEHAAGLEQAEQQQQQQRQQQQQQQQRQPGQQAANLAEAGARADDCAERLLQHLQQLDREQQPQQAQEPQALPADAQQQDVQPAGASQPAEAAAAKPPGTCLNQVLSGLQSMCNHLANLAEQLAACRDGPAPPGQQQQQQLGPATPQQPPGALAAAAAATGPQLHNAHPALRLPPAARLAVGAAQRAARGLLVPTDDTGGEPEVSSKVRVG